MQECEKSLWNLWENAEISPEQIQRQIAIALQKAEDGELFVEKSQQSFWLLEDGLLKRAQQSFNQGFGLRSVVGESHSYAYASEFCKERFDEALMVAKSSVAQNGAVVALGAEENSQRKKSYYENEIFSQQSYTPKVIEVLGAIDKYVRAKDARVVQVSASFSRYGQAVMIMRAEGEPMVDFRPLVRMSVSVVVAVGDRREQGSYGGGGRYDLENLLKDEYWQNIANEALRQAQVNLDARPAPAGEFSVVLGPGWPGILLHEAIGHGLEADFNRKGSSAFSNLLGEMVASPAVSVVDDGTVADARGSLHFDDEGMPTQKTVLIENGRLVNYLSDRLNSRLMGRKSTGNGRRESYASVPLPRMTNTFMLAGKDSPEAIIASMARGIYAPSFGGGQVDITSGKFVFSATEAYWVENGKICYPIKGATLIGDGPSVLRRVSMVGSDLALDPGMGTCGKAGQSVPVGVGQPTIKIDGLTVGGTTN